LVLVEKGLDEAILSYIGIGNCKPLIQFPETDEEKKKNMRVEIIVRF
jgi:outer membrane protein OmpA-like peptidoglycan-associated protein